MDIRMSNIASPMPQIRAKFTNKLGIPLSGCKVYTYEPNSDIPKTTWLDTDKTVENTNPILLDAAGEADIFLNGLYRVVVKDRFGFVIYDVEKTGIELGASFVVSADGSTQQDINDFGGAKWRNKAGGYALGATVKLDNGDVVKSDINGNTNDPNVNMTGWLSIGNVIEVEFIADLIAINNLTEGQLVRVPSVNAEYRYNPLSTNTIKVGDWELKHNKVVYTSQLGVVSDLDCSGILNGVASILTTIGGGEIRLDSNIKAVSPVLVPSNVSYNLNGFSILGGGLGTNDLFKTATLVSEVLVSNIGKPEVSANYVFGAKIKNGWICDCKTALETNLSIDNTIFEDIKFSNVTTTHNFKKSWYSAYRNIMSRSVSAVHYDLDDNANANNFTNVSIVGGGKADGGVGFKLGSPVSALNFQSVNTESVQTGIKALSQLSAVNFQSGYYEDCETAIALTGANGKYGVAVRGGYFNACTTGIEINQALHGVIDSSNYFVNCDTWIKCTDDFSSIDIHINDKNYENNTPNYSLSAVYNITGKRVKTHGRDLLYHSATGDLIASRPVWRGIIDQNYSGNIGKTRAGEVPFCSVTKVFDEGSSSVFSFIIDTNITYDDFVMYAFKFKTNDNNGDYTFNGIFAGTDVVSQAKSDGTKIITASNNNGMVRITVGKMTHPTGVGSCTGRIHII